MIAHVVYGYKITVVDDSNVKSEVCSGSDEEGLRAESGGGADLPSSLSNQSEETLLAGPSNAPEISNDDFEVELMTGQPAGADVDANTTNQDPEVDSGDMDIDGLFQE